MDRRIKKEPTDNEYFEILSMEYDEENHEFHIEFNRSIQIFKIKLLINKLIKGNFVEEFTFENLEPALLFDKKIIGKIKPHYYENDINKIEKFKYITTDHVSIKFNDTNTEDFISLCNTNLKRMIINKEKIIFKIEYIFS